MIKIIDCNLFSSTPKKLELGEPAYSQALNNKAHHRDMHGRVQLPVKMTDKQTNKQTHRQTDIQTGTHKQTYRQTNTDRDYSFHCYLGLLIPSNMSVLIR